ncbi:cytochrome-c peroxidase [Chitinophaga parva]|uniref:Cytochrome-c peroxidase n=1 Tax=Chitinophaga parva TaxID=2169414 RepID=A0A2T7BGB8_9BACT|nr:cytochrome c peroxidase [Chitinophaga parva]PUZ25328.1 cytochrome-c peroxidase [Chitinophaga parva]
MKGLIWGIGAIVLVLSCGEHTGKQKPVANDPYEDSLMQLARNTFRRLPTIAESKTNSLTPEKIRLGKVLFFDTRLSKTGTQSCNSCHNLQTYGVDNLPSSVGDAGGKGDRNSPTVFNAALQNMQFWDGRAADVEEQAGMPILNSAEMAIPHEGFLINRLSSIKLYQDLFQAAFPGEKKPVTYKNLEKAIGAFERTLLTPSRFDSYMEGDTRALTTEEKSGLRLFVESGCSSCHNGVGIGGSMMQKFGLVTDYRTLTMGPMADEGRKQVTHREQDKDIFKVPQLRSVAGTFPYFHDGSIADLDSAVKIMGKAQLNRNLSSEQARQITAFLNSLSGQIDPAKIAMPAELEKK